MPPLRDGDVLWLLVVAAFYGVDHAGVGAGGGLDRQGARHRPQHSGQIRVARAAAGGACAICATLAAVAAPAKAVRCRHLVAIAQAGGVAGHAGDRADVHLFRRAVLHAARPQKRCVTCWSASFDQREARLRTLKIMNDIEHNLTGYLSVVAVINLAVGVCAGVIAWLVGLPDPMAWARARLRPQFHSLYRRADMEAAMFLVGLVTFPDARLCAAGAAALSRHGDARGPFHHAQHGRPPASRSIR